jgi:hypothetical protein
VSYRSVMRALGLGSLFVVAMAWGLACGTRSHAEDPAAVAARNASIATRPIPDPPWAVDGWKQEDDDARNAKVTTAENKRKGVVVDGGTPATAVTAKTVDAGVDAGAKAVAVVVKPPDCTTLCEEARTCVEKLTGMPLDCAKECERSKPEDVEKGLKCRTELAKSCADWMTCLLGPGGG